MFRRIAWLISAGLGVWAAYAVFRNLEDIAVSLEYNLGISAGVFLLVLLLLYLPLLRHIADIVEDHLSTLRARVTSRKTGVDFDVIPKAPPLERRSTTASHRVPCGMCGGPGGPVCERCRTRMAGK
jgi:hypothetical protein